MSLHDIQTMVADQLRDDAGHIAAPELERAIGMAVAQYSKDRPRQVVEDVTADGSSYLPLPAAWVDGDSRIASLEYPVGEWPVSYVSPEWYGVVPSPMGDEIRLAGAVASGEILRATLLVPHTLNASADTIPQRDREPLSSLAAAIVLDQMARLYGQDSDSTIQADSVDRRSKADVYRSLARAARQRYYDALGLDPNRRVAASAVVNLNLPDSRGRDRLTHPSRHR